MAILAMLEHGRDARGTPFGRSVGARVHGLPSRILAALRPMVCFAQPLAVICF